MSNYSYIVEPAAETGGLTPSEASKLADISGVHLPPLEEATAAHFHFFRFDNHPWNLPIPWPYVLHVEQEGRWAVQNIEDHSQIYLVGVREGAAGLVVGLFPPDASLSSVPLISIG